MNIFDMLHWCMTIATLLVLWLLIRRIKLEQRKHKLVLLQLASLGGERLQHLDAYIKPRIYVFAHLSNPNIVEYAEQFIVRYPDATITVVYQAPAWKLNVLGKQLPESVKLLRDESGSLAKHFGVVTFPNALIVDENLDYVPTSQTS